MPRSGLALSRKEPGTGPIWGCVQLPLGFRPAQYMWRHRRNRS